MNSGEVRADGDQRAAGSEAMPDSQPLFPCESGEEVAGRMAGNLCGAATVLMAGLADSLGIFKYMAGRAAETPAEVAAGTGLHERWVRELLYQLATARLVSTDQHAGTFWLSEGQAAVLAQEHGERASPLFKASYPSLFISGFQMFHRLQDVFRSADGRGLAYGEYGPGIACAVCRDLGIWTRHNLVDHIRKVPELHKRLEGGAACADLGCGEGEVLSHLATAYPESTFHGYDISATALAAAHERLAACPNIALKNPSYPDQQMPAKAYDFIITYDAIHDMSRPDQVLPIARQALKDDAWGYLIADVKGGATPAATMQDSNQLARFAYGVSVMLCLNSGMSEEGGLGLGTLGWHTALAEEMLKAAGFAAVEVLDWNNDFNRFFHAKVA
eukprot:jgi/Ulvmu1/8718/UM047_0058.1